MTTSTAVKKDVQKLQRAIVDGLEDVKAQDIQVFDTEHLSSLFERVIVASGTSNRQTKALASSVRDAVREAGFAKPRVEGEANGEWIIVDCGQAVVHIMQPTYRQYYHLEELWGEKPVRLKLGAVKPAAVAAEAPKASKAAPKGEPSLRRSNAAKKGVQEAFPSKAQLRKAEALKAGTRAPTKAPMKKPAAKTAAAKAIAAKAPARKPAPVKAAARTVVVKAPARTTAKVAAKAVTRRPAVKKPVSRKA